MAVAMVDPRMAPVKVSAHKMLSTLRLSPPEGEEPWLVYQCGPSGLRPLEAKYMKAKEASPHQMACCRVNLLQCPR